MSDHLLSDLSKLFPASNVFPRLQPASGCNLGGSHPSTDGGEIRTGMWTLRPSVEHLRSILLLPRPALNEDFTHGLQVFVSTLLAGLLPPHFARFLLSGSPHQQEDGGIRPVVVGETLREKKKPQKPQKSTTPMRKHS